jgi:hypothetical protein
MFIDMTDDNLRYYTHCNSLGEIQAKMSKSEWDEVIANYQQSPIYYRKRNLLNFSLSAILTDDAPSYPLITFTTILSILTLGILPLTILTATFLAIVGTVCGTAFYANYTSLKHDDQKNSNYFLLHYIKLTCADELLQRHGIEVEESQYENLPSKRRSSQLTYAKQALGLGAITSSIIFESYFLCANAIFAAFGFATLAAAMVTPLGIGIALGVSLLLGLYLGYQNYQASVAEQNIKANKKSYGNLLQTKVEQIKELEPDLGLKKSPVPQLFLPQRKSSTTLPTIKHVSHDQKKAQASARNGNNRLFFVNRGVKRSATLGQRHEGKRLLPGG